MMQGASDNERVPIPLWDHSAGGLLALRHLVKNHSINKTAYGCSAAD